MPAPLERVHDVLNAAVENLPVDEDRLVAFLVRNDCHGYSGDPTMCPIAIFISQRFAATPDIDLDDYDISVVPGQVAIFAHHKAAREFYGTVGTIINRNFNDAITNFIHHFDDGVYPQLRITQ